MPCHILKILKIGFQDEIKKNSWLKVHSSWFIERRFWIQASVKRIQFFTYELRIYSFFLGSIPYVFSLRQSVVVDIPSVSEACFWFHWNLSSVLRM
jgi:hypothetical protein